MVKDLWANGRQLLFTRQKSILSAALVMAATFLLSAGLGLVRDRMLAHYFGDSAELGLYFAADRLPGFLFNLLVVGAFSAAFIPVFTQGLKEEGREAAWRLASVVINVGWAVFFLISVVIFWWARPLSNLLSAGSLPARQLDLMANLMRVMLLAQLILLTSSFLTSLLQSLKYFLMPALAPVFYNLGIIIAVVAFSHSLGIFAPAWGMVLGAWLHLLCQMPLALRLGLRQNLTLEFTHPRLRQLTRLMVPRVLGLAVGQVPLFVGTTLAFLISAPAVVVLEFARHLQGLPISIFGLSMAQATLPTLAEESGEDLTSFKKTFLSSWNQMLFFIMPLSVLLIILRVPVVRLIFGAARFSWAATLATAYSVSFFSISIFAQASAYLFNRAFYALQDARTPLRISFYSVLANILLSLYLVKGCQWGVWSLALAFSLTSWLSLAWLFWELDKRVGHFSRKDFVPSQIRMGYASLVTALALWVPMKLLDEVVFDTTRTLNLLVLTAIVSAFGLLIYWLCARLFFVEESNDWRQAIFSLRKGDPPSSALPEGSW